MNEAGLAVSQTMTTLSTYIASANRQELPKPVKEKTKHHLLDTFAAMVSGSRLLPGLRAIDYTRTLGGAGEACVVGSDIVTSVVNAALANGMCAHADETDDSHARSHTHPGCGVVPAALAFAERQGADGMTLINAIALGYDLCTRLTMALDAYAFRNAGHSTHSFGPLFGAGAAAGAIAGLGPTQVRHLLSYCAQQASGISCWARDPEHVEKAFDFGGMPARNGVAAASMVLAGFSAVEDVLSGERNFLVAYGSQERAQMLTQGLGTTYEIMNTNIKRWSVGSPIQAPLDSMELLLREHHLSAGEVDHVVVRISHQGADIVNNREMPDICLQHLMGLMLVDGQVTFASSHDRGRMHDPDVRLMRQRIDLRGDDALERAMPSRQAIVEVTTRDGRVLRHHTKAVRGTAENPLTSDEVARKCLPLLVPVLGQQRAQSLVDAVWAIEELNDVRDLRPLLRA